jgi:hypothetical protein
MKYDKEFHEWARTHPTDISTCGIHAILDEIERLTARVAELREKTRWIPVSERLPEMYEEIDTYNSDGMSMREFTYGAYSGLDDNGKPQAQDGEYFWVFTHWRLQDPPEATHAIHE